MRTLIIVAMLALGGCSAWQEMPVHEKAFHAMNIIDTGQTINISRRPDCYYEANFLTRRIIGEHPSQGAVYASSIGYSLAYHYGRKLIDRRVDVGKNARAWKVVRAVTFGGLLVGKAQTIVHNHDIGLRPWGSACR